MPSPDNLSVDLPITTFGGRVTQFDPQTLPTGASPFNQDVAFSGKNPSGGGLVAGVASRPGMSPFYAAKFTANPAVNYLKTFVDSQGIFHLLSLDALGVVRDESPCPTVPGVPAIIGNIVAASLAQSDSLINREWMAFSSAAHPGFGIDIPRQWDGTNFDRVSQVGPGAGPASVVDAANTNPANPITGGPSRFNNVVTFNIGFDPGWVVGQSVIIAGVVDASFDGTFIIYAVGGPGVFSYQQVGANAGTSGGTAQLANTGNISAGQHNVSIAFITRQQYITKPSPPVAWIAAGNMKVTMTGIPIGPPNVIARVAIFTPVITAPAKSGPFFFFDGIVSSYPTMVIPDNTTTTATFNFDDATLALGTPATNLFNLLELGECASVCSYANRMFWAGERNKLSNLLNLTFDGGFSGAQPLGWTVDATNGAGGSKESANVVWGNAYRITGDGATVTRGLIYQGAQTDYLGVPIIEVNTAYSVRVKLAKGGGIAAGTAQIRLFSGSAGTIGQFSVAQANIGATYTEFIGALCVAQVSIPNDLLLEVYVDGTPTNNGFILFENIEIFPTLQPYNRALVRASYAGDPESFDQDTGYLIIGQATEQSVRCSFLLLDNKLYISTERGLFSTQDDGQNEPSDWVINTVSATVGTGSVRGVGIGESWAIIASHDGVYIFWGGEPVKISQEIQPDWDLINWAYDQTIYVTVDTANKRIHVGAPINGVTSPNVEFVCDYSQLANAEGTTAGQDIAAHPQAYYSVYNPTKVVAPGKARKWTLWNLTMNCATLAVRSDGSYHLLRGNGTGTGKVYDQLSTQLSDDGVAINAQYQTAYFPQMEEEQILQLGSHRKQCKYLTGYVMGAGTLSWTMYGSQNQRALNLSSTTLQNPAPWDIEKNVNFVSERMSLLFGTNAVGSWFQLSKLSPVIQREFITPIRGTV